MAIVVSYQDLAPYLLEQTLILTPNARKLSAVNAGFVELLEEGDVIYAPLANTMGGWQVSLLEELSFRIAVPRIVKALELKTWLKNAISKDENWLLTNELGVAEKVLEAFRIMRQWDASLENLGTLETVENRYFVKWISALQAFLESNQLLPDFEISNFLLEHASEITEFLPKHILLVGFNQLTPVESKLLDLAKQNGCKVDSIFPARNAKMATRIECEQFNQELEFAAHLAKINAENDPRKTIGVVVNQLANHIDLVHQCFSDVFQPEEYLPWETLGKTAYNVSAGQPIADFPPIFIAIKLLQLKPLGFELATLQLIKTSTFIDWGEFADEIRSFLHEQCLLGYHHYSVDRLKTAIDSHENASQLKLLKRRLLFVENKLANARPMSAWIDSWKTELAEWSWMNGLLLENHQALVDEFYSAMQSSVSLASVNPKPSRHEAFEHFQQVLRQTAFQIPSDRTNIHILGILEASGLVFDDLIVVGFARNNWPAKAQFSPFLPVRFQQDNQTPGSSAEREFKYTQKLSQSLLNGASNIWITYSQAELESLTAESALFSHLPISALNEWVALEDKYKVKPDYQWLTDERISLNPSEIKGGAYMLSFYASCPFKGMSQFQLGIRAQQQTQQGIEAKTRGAWLHKALELLWQEIKESKTLNQLSQQELEKLVEQKLSQSKVEFEKQLYATASKTIVDLEFEKLTQQILQWLKIDKQAGEFSVATEVEKELTIGPLQLKFIVDRIDSLADGSIAIIDYKTGNVDVKKWLGPRPDEAQMPAYVLACGNQSISSLSYAKIKTGEIKRVGVWFDASNAASPEQTYQFLEFSQDSRKDRTRYYQANPTLELSDKSLANQWHENLNTLVDAIAEGQMPVSPKSRVESCRYCDFADFCRINEQQQASDKQTVIEQGSNR